MEMQETRSLMFIPFSSRQAPPASFARWDGRVSGGSKLGIRQPPSPNLDPWNPLREYSTIASSEQVRRPPAATFGAVRKHPERTKANDKSTDKMVGNVPTGIPAANISHQNKAKPGHGTSMAVRKISNLSDHYILGGEMGSGYTATVYTATPANGQDKKLTAAPNSSSRSQIAVKVVSKKRQRLVADDQYYRDIYNVVPTLKHPNLLKIYEVLEDENHFYIVMEKCEGTDLVEYVLGFGPGQIPLGECIRVMYQILLSVHRLHQSNLLHRDIKLDNVVFRQKSRQDVVLIDYDMCMFTNRREPPRHMANSNEISVVGTKEYMSPECYKGKYSHASDLWGCGVILFVLLDGHFPFDVSGSKSNDKNKETVGNGNREIRKILRDGFRISDYLRKKHPLAVDLLSRLLVFNEKSRMTCVADAITHPWFTSHTSWPLVRLLPTHRQGEPLDFSFTRGTLQQNKRKAAPNVVVRDIGPEGYVLTKTFRQATTTNDKMIPHAKQSNDTFCTMMTATTTASDDNERPDTAATQLVEAPAAVPTSSPNIATNTCHVKWPNALPTNHEIVLAPSGSNKQVAEHSAHKFDYASHKLDSPPTVPGDLCNKQFVAAPGRLVSESKTYSRSTNTKHQNGPFPGGLSSDPFCVKHQPRALARGGADIATHELSKSLDSNAGRQNISVAAGFGLSNRLRNATFVTSPRPNRASLANAFAIPSPDCSPLAHGVKKPIDSFGACKPALAPTYYLGNAAEPSHLSSKARWACPTNCQVSSYEMQSCEDGADALSLNMCNLEEQTKEQTVKRNAKRFAATTGSLPTLRQVPQLFPLLEAAMGFAGFSGSSRGN